MRIRPAQIGDTGVLLAGETLGTVSGLLIQVAEGEQAHLYGDWRTVAALTEALAGQRVEVVESEDSLWGAHAIRPLDDGW